jgi:hypothetical protein
MRILKLKISQALKKLRQQHLQEERASMNARAEAQHNNIERAQRSLRTRARQEPLVTTPVLKGSSSCKNIMKNYSRAFIIFALSPMAHPYLTPLLQNYNLELSSFVEFVKLQKKFANCIKGLRDRLLLVNDTDSDQVSVMKQIFQEMCVVFLKFFCVNWIYHGKVADKKVHLSYRLKLLRRIRNPATFTYLDDIKPVC